MSMGIYLYFRTESKAAIDFYQEVFNLKEVKVALYSDMPSDPKHPIDEVSKQLVMNASLWVHGSQIMLSDVLMDRPLHMGDNFSIFLDYEDEAEMEREFHALAQGGQVLFPLADTFWNAKYGSLKDKFGIQWQFNHYK
ncbi:MAG: VOC family protein [Erysipelotrichaceae bacterium]